MVSENNKTADAGPEPPSSDQDVVDPLWHRVLNDRFTLLEPIGSGGMGKVYKAIQSPLDRIVAIKVLNPAYANGQDPGFRQRFFLEASLTSKLRHPSTITVIDYGQTADGIFYIAMEYLEGQPLSKLLARHGPFHWTRALQIGQQICRSLREAHKIGIIHRDLKPANVMLLTEDREDIVKVLDFGLVKSFIREDNSNNSEVTNAGMFLGSPQYMAPEQARNHADPRSDVYSLGVVLYHMLAGRPPFLAKDSIDVIFKQMNEPPPPMRSLRPDIDLPREVEALVMKCLEKQPSWRFQSMDDVLEAMRKSAAAGGMSTILTDGNGIGNTPPPMYTREAVAPASPEGTLAIDISVASGARRASLLLRNRKLVGAAVFLSSAAIAFFGSYAITRRGVQRAQIAATANAAPNSLTPVAKPPPPAPEDLPAPSKPTPKMVKFRVSTEPEGAHVSMGGHSVGATPVAFELPASSDGTATAELMLTLKGYHPMTVITGGSGPEVVLTQRLQSRAVARPAPSVVDRREPPQRQPQTAEVAERPEEKKEEEAPAPVQKVAPERSSTGAIAAAAAGSALVGNVAAGGPAPAPMKSAPKQLPSFVFDQQRISAPNPHLPDSFRESHPRQRLRGTYRICVNTDGRVSDVGVLASIPGLDQTITEQLKRTWIYKPQPVPVCGERIFIFNID
jgi:serine/threonine-protein kinase